MEYVSTEGWLLIGMAVFLILAGIASAIHVMWKYKSEIPPDVNPDADGEEILIIEDDVMDDD